MFVAHQRFAQAEMKNPAALVGGRGVFFVRVGR